MSVVKIFGVDVENHIDKLKETDLLSADLMKELLAQHNRMLAHVQVVSEQCEAYKRDAEKLNEIIIKMGTVE